MRRRLYIVALLAGVIGGCYLRPAPSPGFRFACQDDSDCRALDCKGTTISLEKAAGLIEGCDSVEVKNDPTRGVGFRQTCKTGLCEYSCDLATFANDCPSTEGFLFCLNGVCANLCGADDYTKYGYESNDDFCTEPQACIPIAVDGIDPVIFDALGGGGQGGQGGLNLDNLAEGTGFCGLRCDAEGAPACPPGQYCTGALCVPGCDQPTASPCQAGSQCFAFGGYSSCLVTCDPDAETCAEGEICVPGFNICQPTCLGTDAITCPDSFECDATLAVCVPIGGDESSGDSTT